MKQSLKSTENIYAINDNADNEYEDGGKCWDIVFMEGYLKKYGKKRARRRYFVLHHHSSEWKTRLDSFDSQKKWKAGYPPRKTTYLADLFNVSVHKKSPCTFVLYTNRHKFALTAENEKEKQLWKNVIEFNLKQQEEVGPPCQPCEQEEKRWNVSLKTRDAITGEQNFQAIMCSLQIDFINSADDIAFSIPMEYITKYGYTENSCYLEVKCSVSLGDTSLIDGSSVIWLELNDDVQAEDFVGHIIEHKKNRPRANTEKRPSLRPNDFKRSLSHSDLLDNNKQEHSSNYYECWQSKEYVRFDRIDSSPYSFENDSHEDTNIKNIDNAAYCSYKVMVSFKDVDAVDAVTSCTGERYSSACATDDGDDADDDVFADHFCGGDISGRDAYEQASIDENTISEDSRLSSSFSIRDHLLQKTGNPALSKTSTSSSLADDEVYVDENTREQSDRAALRETFVKLNFGTEKEIEKTVNCDSKPEDSTTKRLRKKQNRHLSSHETVEGSNFLGAKKDSTDDMLNTVNLIGYRAKNNRFQEPQYEAIRDLAIKGGRKIPSNTSTPEGSPRLFHNRKYVLNNGFPDLTQSPKLGKNHKNKLNKTYPPLPKRNIPFYTDASDERASNHYSSNMPKEPRYADISVLNIKNFNSKINKRARVDHPYSEIAPRAPRISLNSSDNDDSPNSSPNSTPLFEKRSYKRFGSIADGSKSDGDLSDSDVLDVPRTYNRRRSKTGNADDIPDLARFYEVPSQPGSRTHIKQRVRSYEKDYIETNIQPRGLVISKSATQLSSSPAYENNTFLQRSSSADEEPTYAKPSIEVTPEYENDKAPAYENNELFNYESIDPRYTSVRPKSDSVSSETSESNYGNICFTRKENLQYADIDITNRHHYDNLSSPEPGNDSSPRNSRVYSTTKNSKYTEIDFQKSDGLKEALSQLRVGDKNATPEPSEYKIDLSHIKFTKSSDSKRNSRNLDN